MIASERRDLHDPFRKDHWRQEIGSALMERLIVFAERIHGSRRCTMKKVIVIGCPGSGKSVFSRELHEVTGLPLYPLDTIYWREDRTTVAREQFIERILEIAATDSWIMDGNYDATMELRMSLCDTVFFLDYPTEVCYDGILKRCGTTHPDLPWTEPAALDPEFADFVLRYNAENRPIVLERLRKYADREIRIFKSRAEATAFLNAIRRAGSGERCEIATSAGDSKSEIADR